MSRLLAACAGGSLSDHFGRGSITSDLVQMVRRADQIGAAANVYV